MTTLDQALDQLTAHGLPTPPSEQLLLDGQLRRYDFAKQGDKRCWHVFFEHIGKNGRQYVSGSFGAWGLVDSQNIATSTDGLDPAEVKLMHEKQASQRQALAEQEAQEYAQAREEAFAQWRSGTLIGHSDYLQAKGLDHFNDQPASFKFCCTGRGLLVPMVNYKATREYAFVGLQFIENDGTKRFTKGVSKKGSACRLGEIENPRQHIFFCEGFATGLTIYLAVSKFFPVIVCWDAGNLPTVAQTFRTLHPRNPFIFAGDDDWKTTVKDPKTGRELPYNTGVIKAFEAAKIAGNACYTKPSFRDLSDGIKRQDKWTDFNDLHKFQGIDAVATQLLTTVNNWSSMK